MDLVRQIWAATGHKISNRKARENYQRNTRCKLDSWLDKDEVKDLRELEKKVIKAYGELEMFWGDIEYDREAIRDVKTIRVS